MYRIRVDSYQHILSQVDADTVARILSHADTQKSNRFHFPEDRDRFIAARVLFWMESRTAIASGKPVELPLDFHYNTYGKPYMEHVESHFNWSHSGDLIALTIGSVPVGIDIEQVPERPLFDYKSLCSMHEHQWIHLQMEAETLTEKEAFICIWSAKEAVLKAIGTGLSTDPRKVSIRMDHPTEGNWICTLNDRTLSGTSISFRFRDQGYALSWCSTRKDDLPNLLTHVSQII